MALKSEIKQTAEKYTAGNTANIEDLLCRHGTGLWRGGWGGVERKGNVVVVLQLLLFVGLSAEFGLCICVVVFYSVVVIVAVVYPVSKKSQPFKLPSRTNATLFFFNFF